MKSLASVQATFLISFMRTLRGYVFHKMIYFSLFNLWSSFLLVINGIIILKSVLGNSAIPNVSQELISKLYSKYKEAVEDGTIISTRRLFTQNRQYKIHVKRLKQVNGFKRHNLLIKEVKSEKNPLIYINNPVESKIPNAYLTLEEFKQALTNRILTQRETTKIIQLRMTKELKTRLISNIHSKMITFQPKNDITSKSMIISKLSTNLKLENLTNSTKTYTSSRVPNWSTTFKIESKTFKDEETLTTESSKIIKLTESITTNKENIVTFTTAVKESTENISAEHPKTKSLNDISESTIVTVQINTESSNDPETYKTEAPKNYIEETTKLETAEIDLSKNTSQLPTSLHTEELRQKESIEVVTEDVTETEKRIEDPETTIEIVTDTTRSTRKTLGRPLVFMGGN